MLINKDVTFKSNKFLGYMIVQYNIWPTGKIKLRKKIKKQIKKANKELMPFSLIFCLTLIPPWSGE